MNPQTARKLETARTNMKIAVALSDFSAKEACEKAGISPNVLGKFLRNETMITFGNMVAICDVLGIPLSLITSEQQITPARIRLAKAVEKMTDSQLADFLNKEEGRD